MKKSRKLLIWIVILISILSVLGTFFVRFFQDESRLTPLENEWVNNNLNKVLNVSVVNDVNVFGKTGSGVFYDYLTDFSLKYNLKVNAITYKSSEQASGITFGVSNILKENELEFYKDHYVLISKMNELIPDESTLKNKKIGVLSSNLNYVKNYLNIGSTYITFETRDELLKALEGGVDINSALVPRIEYMDQILAKDYFIISHFTNIPRYYYLSLEDSNFSSVLKKYFQKWKNEDFQNSMYQQEFQMFVNNLGISKTDVDQLQSVVYNYGFINNSPYEILSGGNYGGINAAYLNEFARFSDIEFNFERYSNYKKLVSGINSGKVNLYFGYQNFTSGGSDIASNIILNYDVLAPLESNLVVTSLKSLQGKTIFVEENSLLHSKLNGINGMNIQTYEGEKGLKEVVRKKEIVLMDHNLSLYYQKGLLNSYSIRYQNLFDTSYVFKAHTNETFIKLFSKYIDYLDENTKNYEGFYHHTVTMKNGTILGTIAKYFIYIFIAFLILFYFGYRQTKKVKLVKKIRKDDKLKFIDQMTSLKNRNYLNENISQWNKNTIYPQTMIVIDLNRVQEINDTIGYVDGDLQIKAAANILIKTQLDNSDIMRTDGNEFMIYLVGYQAKQITTFIHKLNKEFKNLPYQYGACIGYSMIIDDIKSVEDAINEAIEDVRKQKEMQKEELEG